ncbi:membrane protein [Streptomyces sulfonofaciens]|uniref:Membrane protein n=1 Tax=Streptomyces sulfonofaciens TaxID=68272 RepID=A0A919FRI6_9ACTN|nr:molybdopterin-dependent oxidoreductase [Streptomyces sulfonofaciens]GHH70636.1 membrane protein [Streptomyces sulfonofaciens]
MFDLRNDRLPTSPRFWRSPLRGPWLTSLLGLVLLGGITLVFVTGLLSYAAYNPNLGVNDQTPDKGLLGFYLFSWPTHPHWLYRLTQGVHVTLGIVLVPVVLAKLWSVVPKLFELPPARSVGHALERISLLLLVGGVLFEFTTGVLNVQLDYIFPGSFYPLHFYGAWVFFAAFLTHVVLRTPQAVRVLREGRWRSGADGADGGEGRAGAGGATDVAGGGGGVTGAAGERVAREAEGLASPRPAPATLSRRGAVGVVGAGSLVLLLVTAGQSIGGPLRRLALLAPHGGGDPQGPNRGGNSFQINKTAATSAIDLRETGTAWRLTVEGPKGVVRLDRAALLRMAQHTAALPIACVEGWSTDDQHWSGVRLRDLAALVGYAPDAAYEGTPRPGERLAPDVLVESLQRRGAFRHAALRANQVRDSRSLLALHVNGADLSPDHGYPARIIVPAAPGVLNTKWVARLTFGDL